MTDNGSRITGLAYQDAHIHIQDADSSVLQTEDVGRFFCCATSYADWQIVKSFSEKDDRVIPFVGIHPWYIKTQDDVDGYEERLREALINCACGVGEVGLDGTDKASPSEWQEEIFRISLMIAKDLKRPVLIHCVKRWDRLFAHLEQVGAHNLRFCVHGFTASREILDRIIALGGYVSLSFRGIEKINRLVAVPEDKLLIETDWPYVPAQAFGKKYGMVLKETYQRIAGARQVTREELQESTFNNAAAFMKGLL